MEGMAALVHPWSSQGHSTVVQNRPLDMNLKAQDLPGSTYPHWLSTVSDAGRSSSAATRSPSLHRHKKPPQKPPLNTGSPATA